MTPRTGYTSRPNANCAPATEAAPAGYRQHSRRGGARAFTSPGFGWSKRRLPVWPYSWVAALEPGRTSWTLPLDAVRLGPEDDATEATAAQLRDVVMRIIAAGQWHEGDPDMLAVVRRRSPCPRRAVAGLYAILGIDQSHSRPHVSN